MIAYGIVADDLTGACDCAAQFSRLGARAVVLPDVEALPPPAPGAWEVVAVSTASRACGPSEARARTGRAVAFLRRAGAPMRYKKVDSTLRGHLRDELEEALGESERAVLAPAFPLAGRTVEDGVARMHGSPVHETGLAADVWSPVSTARIADLFRPPLAPAGALRLDALEGGPAAVAEELRRARARGVRLVISDASRDEHLRALAHALAGPEASWLAVGSAGLARELAACVVPTPAPPPAPPPTAAAGPVLVVAGSRQSSTEGQVAALRELGGSALFEVDPAQADALASEDALAAAAEQLARAALDATGRGARLIALVLGGADADDPQLFRARSPPLNRLLGLTCRALESALHPRGLVLTGGDVAAAVLRALGIPALQVGAEIAPGLPLCWADGGPLRGLRIATKAGGYGGPRALADAALALAAR